MAWISRAALSPDGLIAGRSVFDRGDVLAFVFSRAVAGRLDAVELRRVVERVEATAIRLEVTPPEPLGAFTSREQLRLERGAVEVAVAMADEGHGVRPPGAGLLGDRWRGEDRRPFSRSRTGGGGPGVLLARRLGAATR